MEYVGVITQRDVGRNAQATAETAAVTALLAISFDLNLGYVVSGLALLALPWFFRYFAHAVGQILEESRQGREEVRLLLRTVGREHDEEGHAVEPAPGTVLARLKHQDACTDALRQLVAESTTSQKAAATEVAAKLEVVTAAATQQQGRIETQVMETNGTVKEHSISLARLEGAVFGNEAMKVKIATEALRVQEE